MEIEFYNVKTRVKVRIPESQVKKTIFKRKKKNGTEQLRYALRAEIDGMKLTKFISQKDWELLNAPIVD